MKMYIMKVFKSLKCLVKQDFINVENEFFEIFNISPNDAQKIRTTLIEFKEMSQTPMKYL